MTRAPAPSPCRCQAAPRCGAARAAGRRALYPVLGIQFDRRGDELTAILPFDDKLIGNPMLPALHGGVTAAFLEVAAIIELSWSILWEEMEAGKLDPRTLDPHHLPRCPRPSISRWITCARACRAMPMRGRGSTGRGGAMHRCMSRHGRTTASRLFAQGTGHFLMPPRAGADE
jgi:hypothetical protein